MFLSCSVTGSIWRRFIIYLYISWIPRHCAFELAWALANKEVEILTFLLQVSSYNLYILYMVEA